MHNTIIPQELLAKSDKILFVAHLAIGDFTYLQNYIAEFARHYPHIKVHIWVDELRRTRCFWRWKYLKKNVLYDWLVGCPFIDKIYNRTYSNHGFRQSIQEARKESYPIVVSLAGLRPHRYARLARRLSPKGFVVGLRGKTSWFSFGKKLAYRNLDAFYGAKAAQEPLQNVSAVLADTFQDLFGFLVEPEQRYPFVTIPNQWMVFAKLRFLKWGIGRVNRRFGKVIFINSYAKIGKRSWPLEYVASLIKTVKQQDTWGDISFIVNVVPEKLKQAQRFFDKHSFTNTFVFCAEHNFFQLPAIMGLCDVVVSVETSTMHLAAALNVPMVALMRLKNPEWAPLTKNVCTIITVKKRSEWVKDIPAQVVTDALLQIMNG